MAFLFHLFPLVFASWNMAATPVPAPLLDVEAFRNAMIQRHVMEAKRNLRLKQEIKALERLTRLVPEFPGPWAALSVREAATGNAARAGEDFRHALSRSGD